MEQSLQKNPVFINETILNETVEQPIECDALLPDYCPDIRRILKCTMTPALMSKNLMSGRLTIEGLAMLGILYLSAGGELARGEYKVPFSRTMELPADADNPLITVTLSQGRLSCRAVSSRRLDIRGSVVIRATGVTCTEEPLICGCEDETLQLRRRERTGVRLAAQSEREQRLTQTMTLSGSGAPLTRILRCDAHIARREERIENGRLLVRGEVQASALAAREDGGWERAECTLPFEVPLELPGLGDDTPCEVWQEICCAAAEPAADEDGEYRSIGWDITIMTYARLYKPYRSTVCTDCYSTRYASSGRAREICTTQLHSICGESETWRDTIPLPEQMGEIAALWITEEGCTVRPEGDGLLAEGKLNLTLLGRMGDQELYSFDRALELSHAIPAPEGARWNARLECRSCQWELRGGELSLTCELWWSGAVWSEAKDAVLEEVTVDEKRPKSDPASRGLYIYMAEPGEDLWEVARRYNTSEDRIRADNSGIGEECPGGALLIPV